VTSQQGSSSSFFGTGVFDWQLTSSDRIKTYNDRLFSEERWWGDFPRDLEAPADMFAEYPWAIGPFVKYNGNPILEPTPGAWDQGHGDGGVHNGSILLHDGRFYYVYRGERPIDVPTTSSVNYIGNIGMATSDDGIHFVKENDHSPFFRKGDDRRFSYEDVCCVRHGGKYYLFCNQWLWDDMQNPKMSGVFLATSTDLRHWERVGILFTNATRTHRNGVVLQNAQNEAVPINGRFIMYINDGLIAYSDDLIHWESKEIGLLWPGGEGCFALADHDPTRPEDIVLFTGGHHTGHFYAIGEVLLSKSNPEVPLSYLPRPVLTTDPGIPYENGRSAHPPHEMITTFSDCIFFNGLTRHGGKWWMYYGGSEYYTCLATAEAGRRASPANLEGTKERGPFAQSISRRSRRSRRVTSRGIHGGIGRYNPHAWRGSPEARVRGDRGRRARGWRRRLGRPGSNSGRAPGCARRAA
jgi:predicted GH43/DUF377 family glycosyl hydrolase